MPAQVTFRIYEDNELVIADDFNQDSDAARQLAGDVFALLLNAQNGLPTLVNDQVVTPLAIALDGGDLNLTIGGAGQTVLVTSRLVDTCPAQVYAIPTNSSGSPRQDVLYIQYVQLAVNPQQREDENDDGTTGSVTIHSAAESIEYQYVTNVSNATIANAGGAGWTPFATISVPNNASAASQATVSYLFETMSQLLQNASGSVRTLNSYDGDVLIVAGSNVAIDSPQPGQIRINATVEGGTAGPPGPVGPMGQQGERGETGPPGQQGSQGVPGTTGATGPAGPDGGVGSMVLNTIRLTASLKNTPVTLQLQYALPGGGGAVWQLYAQAVYDLGGGSMTLAGANASNWESSKNVQDQEGIEQVELTGTSAGGYQPSVNLSCSGSGTPGYKGILKLMAVRIS